jgi:DNA-binding MarR family transcriptional regulator
MMAYNCRMAANGGLDQSELKKYPGYLLARSRFLAFRTFERKVGKPLALKPVEFSVLLLMDSNEDVSQAQLAQALGVAAPNMTGILRRLEERGLVAREPSPTDRRVQHLVPTREGSKLLANAIAASRKMDQEWMSPLSKVEQAMLLELLGRLAPLP